MTKKNKRPRSKPPVKPARTSWISRNLITLSGAGAVVLCYAIGIITLRYMDTLPHQDVATRAALFSSVTGFIAMVLAALAVVLAGAAFTRKDRRP